MYQQWPFQKTLQKVSGCCISRPQFLTGIERPEITIDIATIFSIHSTCSHGKQKDHIKANNTKLCTAKPACMLYPLAWSLSVLAVWPASVCESLKSQSSHFSNAWQHEAVSIELRQCELLLERVYPHDTMSHSPKHIIS